jgi:hypothetical protein
LAGIKRQNITVPGDGSLRGVIRRCKAHQCGRGRMCFGSHRSEKLLRHSLSAKPKNVDWVFCAINHGRCIDRAICDRTVNKIIKQSIVKLRGERLREAEISGHHCAWAPPRSCSSRALAPLRLCGPAGGAAYPSCTRTSIWQSTTSGLSLYVSKPPSLKCEASGACLRRA